MKNNGTYQQQKIQTPYKIRRKTNDANLYYNGKSPFLGHC